MSSTYSELKFELMGTGEQAGTWGNITNTNLGTAINEAIANLAPVDTGTTNYTLPWLNVNTTQAARHFGLNLYTTGTQPAPFNVNVPAIQKPYMVNNSTTQVATVRISGGSGVAVPVNKTTMVYANGSNVMPMFNYMPDLTVGTFAATTAIPLSSGGTGASTLAAGVVTSNGTVLSTVTKPSGDLVGTDAVQTLSEKRITPRVYSAASLTNITPDFSNYDQTSITAQSTASLAFDAPFLTAPNGTKYIFCITTNGSTNVTLTFASGANGYRAVGILLPTIIYAGKTMYLGCIYNSSANRWDIIALSEN